jgi:hypothetical protein
LNFSQFEEEVVADYTDTKGCIVKQDESIAAQKKADDKKNPRSCRKNLQFLDEKIIHAEEFKSVSTKQLVLMFDESQLLLKKNYGVNGFLFQCIRLWLREEPGDFQVVADFAGTTSSLVSFNPSDTLEKSSESVPSRGGTRKFLPNGRYFPPPYFQTTTIDCFRHSNAFKNMVAIGTTEFDTPVPYGCPFFAVMSAKKELNIHQFETVLSRMLLENGSGLRLLLVSSARSC